MTEELSGTMKTSAITILFCGTQSLYQAMLFIGLTRLLCWQQQCDVNDYNMKSKKLKKSFDGALSPIFIKSIVLK